MAARYLEKTLREILISNSLYDKPNQIKADNCAMCTANSLRQIYDVSAQLLIISKKFKYGAFQRLNVKIIMINLCLFRFYFQS